MSIRSTYDSIASGVTAAATGQVIYDGVAAFDLSGWVTQSVSAGLTEADASQGAARVVLRDVWAGEEGR